MSSQANLFRIKFIVALAAVCLVALVGYVFYRGESAAIMNTLEQDASVLSEILLHSMRRGMLENDRESTSRMVSDLSGLEQVSRIMVFDREGTVRHSGDSGEEGGSEPLEGAFCVPCHEGEVPRGEPLSTMALEGGERVLRSFTPIRADAGCRGCHEGGGEVVGVLLVDLSAKRAGALLEDFRRATFFLLVSITAVFGLLVFFDQVVAYVGGGPWDRRQD